MRRDLNAFLGDFQAGKPQDVELAAAYLRQESLRVRRVSGRYVLQVYDDKGLVASIDHGSAETAMDSFRRAIPMLGSLNLLRKHGLVFPDSLNN